MRALSSAQHSGPPRGTAGEDWAERQRRTGRFFALIWLVYLIYPLIDLFEHRGSARRLLGVVGLVLFVATYVWAWSGRDGWVGRRIPWALGIIFTLAAGLSALLGANGVGLFIFAAPLAARLSPSRLAWTAVGIVAATCVAAMLALHLDAGTILALGITCAGTGVAILGMRRLLVTTLDLRAAREEISRLATVEERLRIARDVHDLLGHSLSVIALKADLAGRVLPADSARAAGEIADIQMVARRSLTEVREAVAGYRRLRLEEELARSRAALEAAGIRCAYAQGAGDVPEAAGAVLAWVVREATTNVINHSRAGTCQMRVTCDGERVQVTIEDDGVGPGAGGPNSAAGHGLTGLTERVRVAGGDLCSGPGTRGGFVVEAWVTAQESPVAPATAGRTSNVAPVGAHGGRSPGSTNDALYEEPGDPEFGEGVRG